jgi:colanic acid biosynthesis glycosyl transferase WcaI
LAVGGLALITAEPGTNLFEIVNDNKMGVVIDSENLNSLENAILEFCISDNSILKLNGRKYAENYLNKDSILNKLFNKLENRTPVNIDEKRPLEYLELK